MVKKQIAPSVVKQIHTIESLSPAVLGEDGIFLYFSIITFAVILSYSFLELILSVFFASQLIYCNVLKSQYFSRFQIRQTRTSICCANDAHTGGEMRPCLATRQGSAPVRAAGPASLYLLSEVASLLRPHSIHPVRSSFLKVGLDARLERLILPDGGGAEGRARELGVTQDKGSVTAAAQALAEAGHIPGNATARARRARPRDPRHRRPAALTATRSP